MAPALLDVDYYVPLVNRKATLIASTITLLVVAWIAVLLRLYTRFRVARSPGWDDLFVFCAVVSSTAGTVCVHGEIAYGLGLHMRTLLVPNADGSGVSYKTLEGYLFWLFLSNCTYAITTTFIKNSILFQYLRLFPRQQNKIIYGICIFLAVVVAAWGLTYFFILLFGCSPIQKTWKPNVSGRCILFGSSQTNQLYIAYTSQTASNMCLDLLILMVPLPLLARSHLRLRQKAGLIGLFSIGTIAVVCSALRLCFVIKSRAGSYPTADPPWYAPPIILMSDLEVNLAIVTASMPIFWPYISNLSFGRINVVQEVIVRNETRKTWLMSRRQSLDLDTTSLRRNSDTSETRLQRSGSTAGAQHSKYYGDPRVAELVIGSLEESFKEENEERTLNHKGSHTAQAWYDPVALQTFHKK